jgi:hypothetical protein
MDEWRSNAFFWLTAVLLCLLQFAAGPCAAAITLTNATSTAWQVADAVLTPQPRIAPTLPLPPAATLINLQDTRAGPLL